MSDWYPSSFLQEKLQSPSHVNRQRMDRSGIERDGLSSATRQPESGENDSLQPGESCMSVASIHTFCKYTCEWYNSSSLMRVYVLLLASISTHTYVMHLS